MGGKEGARGYLYQAFASVLEAMCQKNWDKIYIEFDSDNDKVDIALERDKRIFKSIQVKSSKNLFTQNLLETWLTDLINDDVGSSEFKLFLIGQCDEKALTFINSIDKFQRNQLDKKAQKSLKEFDIEIIKDKKIDFECISFDVEILEGIVSNSLFKYISHNGHRMTYDQICFIASATVNDQMISSTHGKGIDRKTFDEALEKRILLVADQYSPKRRPISIISFSRGAEYQEDEIICLSLTDKFNGRQLKDGYDWNNDVYSELEKFLTSNTKNTDAYKIYLDTHTSLAFAAGRILDSKSGINIFPIQRTAIYGTVLWNIELSHKANYPNWNSSFEVFQDNQFDSALILNVTHNIYNHVVEYIKESNLSIGRIISCTLNEVDATNFSIQDGNHALALASSVYEIIAQRTTAERQATLHIFASAPNAFMFFLGKNSLGFGKCVLYEYDFEQHNSCSYSQSIKFTN